MADSIEPTIAEFAAVCREWPTLVAAQAAGGWQPALLYASGAEIRCHPLEFDGYGAAFDVIELVAHVVCEEQLPMFGLVLPLSSCDGVITVRPATADLMAADQIVVADIFTCDERRSFAVPVTVAGGAVQVGAWRGVALDGPFYEMLAWLLGGSHAFGAAAADPPLVLH